MKHGIWEIYQSSSGRAIRLCKDIPKPNAYLFVWNPKIWPWDSLEQDIQYLKINGKVSDKWSCKSHKTIKPGDRVFLAKVGSDPRGIFASGIVSSMPFLSKDRIDRSKTINCVSIDFDVLLNPKKEQILKLESLKEGNLSKQLWMSQSSGISIRQELIAELEDIWFNFLNSNKIKHNPFISSKNDDDRSYNEGKSNQVIQTIYERNPAARKKCIEYYGYSCSVCNFNFENHYGEIGKNYVHVHHLKLIAKAEKEYEVDPIKDLRPVCPNCHAMLHKQNPPFKIEYLNSLIIK
jgi:5-methylcytosine-specific restriction protein A